jgi:hypothetical protein
MAGAATTGVGTATGAAIAKVGVMTGWVPPDRLAKAEMLVSMVFK